jgi:hypothetical protein
LRSATFRLVQLFGDSPPGFDLAIAPSVLDTHPAHFRETMLHYGYVDAVENTFILCCDDYRFVNHGDVPNIRADRSKEKYGVDIAVRDICAGEELTVD